MEQESNLQGSIKPFTNSQNSMFAINWMKLSHYLKIDKILLIKMIQIFDELDFVTIDNGVMTVNKEAEKREIEDSQIFQNLKRLVKFQELMALGTPQEIYDWLYK